MEKLANITKSRALHIVAMIGGWGFTGLMLGLGLVLGVFYYYSHDLPDPGKLSKYEPPIVTRLYAQDGRLLAEYAKEHRLYVPLEAVPRRLIDAFLSAEDKNFYQHSGIDFMSLVRAALTNLNNISENKALVGGSTITQQVVKNFLLSNEKSIERKVKEAILSFRISRIYSKDRILELYLNEIYLGLRSYGVGAAAMNYFNKSLDELTIAESAYLAALPKGPSNYHPLRHYDRAKERRDWVLERMREDGRITQEEADIAMASPITVHDRAKSEVAHADFFAEAVRRQLADMYGSQVLYEGGLFVKTTVDPPMQEYADEALRHALTEYDRRHGYRGPVATLESFDDWRKKVKEMEATTPLYGRQQLAIVNKLAGDRAEIITVEGVEGFIPLAEMKWARRYVSNYERGPEVTKPADILYRGDVVIVEPVSPEELDKDAGQQDYRLLQVPTVNGALVAIDPHTGRVLAMSGGYSALDSEFNRAIQAQRQPGSAFKPFVYLAGLEQGLTPATLVLDAPITIPQGPGLPDWTPQNYSGDYLGNVTMRIGLEKSRNAMTVYLASMLGIKAIKEVSRRFGIYDDMPPHYSAVLGARETTLLNLVNAYAMIVNGGKRIAPSLIERIDDRYGKIIFRRDQRPCEGCQATEQDKKDLQRVPPMIPDNRETVVDEATAYQMVHMLRGVVERGTATRANSLNMPLGGKTGTTNDSRDAWFIGFSPDLVVGLYVGFDQPQPLGNKETGSSVALPGFIKFMEMAKKDKPSRPFSVPPGIRMIKIDRWTGQMAYIGADPSRIIVEAFKSYEQPGYAGYQTPAPVRQYDSPYEANPNWPGYATAPPPQVPVQGIYHIPGTSDPMPQPMPQPPMPNAGYPPERQPLPSWPSPAWQGGQQPGGRYAERYQRGGDNSGRRYVPPVRENRPDYGTGGLY